MLNVLQVLVLVVLREIIQGDGMCWAEHTYGRNKIDCTGRRVRGGKRDAVATCMWERNVETDLVYILGMY